MGKRLSEKPIRIGFAITESGANTFTTVAFNLPALSPVVLRTTDITAIGVEVMKVITEMNMPDPEANQNNNTTFEIVKGQAPTALLGKNNQRVIARRKIQARGIEVTAVGEIHHIHETHAEYDMTDGDGNGELVVDGEIHLSVQGAGNSAAGKSEGYLLVHLLEVDSKEAIFEMIEQST